METFADGNHSLNQLSLSLGMFFFCCHTATLSVVSASQTPRQNASLSVLLEKTRWNWKACRGDTRTSLPCDSVTGGAASMWGTDPEEWPVSRPSARRSTGKKTLRSCPFSAFRDRNGPQLIMTNTLCRSTNA